MHPNALLDLTTELLKAVLKLDSPADGVVSAFFRQHRNLGARERHTLAETTYTVLRQRLLFQHFAQSGHGSLERRLAILGWQGSETMLRGALGPHEQQWLAQLRGIDCGSLAPKLRHNLPDWLAAPLQKSLGDDAFWALATSLNEAAPLDLRVNALKAKRDEVQAALAAADIAAEPTPYSPWGLRVQGKPALNKLELFTRGDVEVQDEGSQLLALLTDPKRGEMVVDFCAGAGGKTLALGALMRSTGRLYAFDISPKRLAGLKPRLARSGLSNVHPQRIEGVNDARVKRLAGKIDRGLVDAPCSGLGTLRRNPDMKWRQTPEDVAELVEKQKSILAAAARLVKPGGRLVYATCSILEEEKRGVVEDFLRSAEFTLRPAGEVLEKSGIRLQMKDYLELWPHLHGTDGFFAAVLERAA